MKARLQRNYKDDALDVTVALANAARPEIPEDDLKPKIFITGEVLRPGPYAMRQATTLVQALSLAGGLGPFAAKRRIQIHRGTGADETIFHFDYKAYEAGANLDANIPRYSRVTNHIPRQKRETGNPSDLGVSGPLARTSACLGLVIEFDTNPDFRTERQPVHEHAAYRPVAWFLFDGHR